MEYDKSNIKGRIIDLDSGEEYFNYRLENSAGYSTKIRQQFIQVLLDIRQKCCELEMFSSNQAIHSAEYIRDVYESEPEFLWKSSPSFAVFRHSRSKKWFALIGDIALNKINRTSSSEMLVTFLNVKADKNEVENLLKLTGYYPAYHMNKRNWITIILDDLLTDGEVKRRIDNSYNLVKR